jgi:hypothetical protein
MGASSRYWNIWRISLKTEKVRYKYCLVPTAQEFCDKEVVNASGSNVQSALLSHFHSKNSADTISRAQAGLCLRCYISDPILKACKKIDNLFSGEKHFNYQDLLPYVLNDDGKTLVILDSDRKNQLVLDKNGETRKTAYKFFSVKVLQTFDADSLLSMSLDNWAYLQTKQNPEIRDFLSEFGFQHLSDWALLNRARLKQLQRLSVRDRQIVEVFHAVYRRDRISLARHFGMKRCPDPSLAQLREMLSCLQQQNININTSVELMKQLQQVAMQLRQYDIWSYREPLDIYDPDTKTYTTRTDLSGDSLNESLVEQQEILEFFHQQVSLALSNAIEQEIGFRMSSLRSSKKYAAFAPKLLTGLQLYYYEGMSLKDIAPKLGMTSWDQARRILNPGELLSKVRALTAQQILEKMLEKARSMGLTKIPPEPDYLKTLVEQIEAFVDAEIFTEAAEEIRAGKSRSMSSLYAQQIRLYCSRCSQYVEVN